MNKTIRRRKTPAFEFEGGVLPALLQRLYHLRGVGSAGEVETGLGGLIPFHNLKHIDKAVARLVRALDQQERVLIIGDYDADGATSTAVCIRALRAFGFEDVSYLVPNRFEYGYGLTPEIVDVADEQKPDLIVTVDNGIASVEGVARANALKIDVVITDHHLAGNELPAAVAIVNPNQPGDTFASKNLAGVGVIFYVMLALRAHLREQKRETPNMAMFLDLVALGTVADVVVLDKNNRILVEQGLRRIRAGKACVGILKLLMLAKRDYDVLASTDLGFAVAPRLNAAGRLEDMSLGIECLLTDDENKAQQAAAQLDQLNHERKSIEHEMKVQASKMLAQLKLSDDVPFGVCLYDKRWHQGVVGILASRVKDKVHRPVIAFANENDTILKGSARSIPGVHIRDVLDRVATKHPDIIQKFGGHAQAAGLSLNKQHFDAFKQAFSDEVEAVVSKEALEKKIVTDGALKAEECSLSTAQMLRFAGPWGQGFEAPLFDNVFVVLDQYLVGQKHLKLVLSLEDTGEVVNAIAFNVDLNLWPHSRCDKIHAVYRMDVNRFRGMETLQLIIEYLYPL